MNRRRRIIQALASLGLTAPMAAQWLMHAGIVNAADGKRDAYKPTKRGGGGMLKLLIWQAPTILNPHLSSGTKDTYASRLYYQSLAEWDNDGNLIPILAAEIPSLHNGGLDPGGRWVIWNLKPNVKWHDGTPFSVDDLIFNQQYAADLASNAVTLAVYRDILVEKLGPLKARVVFPRPTPFWADAFVGRNGLMIPKHAFGAYRGAKSRDAPANLSPISIGPYKPVSFVPGDALKGIANPLYHEPNKPFFDAIEIKGGGDAVSAARAVLQTGEFDYGYNLQVEDEILKRLEGGGKGRVVIIQTGSMEHIRLNMADPWSEVDGERGNPKSRHPIFSDAVVREAFSLLVDRKSIQEHIYGRTAVVATNFLNFPRQFNSPNLKWEFSVEKANALLDTAGWKRGPDGIRAKDQRRLKFLFQTATNAPRQKTQAVVKQACSKAGIDLELKSVPSSVFFSTDPGNSDTVGRFSADLQMYSWTQGQPDPSFFMKVFTIPEISSKANKWAGRNSGRWQNAEYDRLALAAEFEMDAAKRTAAYIRMNDLVVESHYVVPVVNRCQVLAVAKNLRAQFSAWSSDLFLLQDWYRE